MPVPITISNFIRFYHFLFTPDKKNISSVAIFTHNKINIIIFNEILGVDDVFLIAKHPFTMIFSSDTSNKAEMPFLIVFFNNTTYYSTSIATMAIYFRVLSMHTRETRFSTVINTSSSLLSISWLCFLNSGCFS